MKTVYYMFARIHQNSGHFLIENGKMSISHRHWAIALQKSVAEAISQTQQTAASEIEQVETETIKDQERCQELIQALQQWEAIAQPSLRHIRQRSLRIVIWRM